MIQSRLKTLVWRSIGATLGGLWRAGSWASRGAMDREQLLLFQLCCEVDTLLHTLGELWEQRSPGNPPHLLPLCDRPRRAPGGVSLPSCPPGPGHRNWGEAAGIPRGCAQEAAGQSREGQMGWKSSQCRGGSPLPREPGHESCFLLTDWNSNILIQTSLSCPQFFSGGLAHRELRKAALQQPDIAESRGKSPSPGHAARRTPAARITKPNKIHGESGRRPGAQTVPEDP